MEEIRIETSEGEVLIVREVWNTCHGHMECGAALDVYTEDGEFLHEIALEMPDTDDPDFDIEEFSQRVEEELDFIDSCMDDYEDYEDSEDADNEEDF